MKRLISILIALSVVLTFSSDLCAQKKERTPIRMGGMMRQKDSTRHSGRVLDQRLFMPKGAMSAGVQFSYFDFSSTDSEIMLILNNLHATANYFSLAPSFSYMIADNKALGLRLKFSNANVGIAEAELSLLSDDLSLDVESVRGLSQGIQAEAFYRSYVGLDEHGRFGLFNDIALQYTNSKTSFTAGGDNMNSYTLANKIKIATRPGMEVFVMNNVSTQFSIGIGGVSYSNTKYFKNNELVGTKNNSKARFMLDITDISMGLSLHF